MPARSSPLSKSDELSHSVGVWWQLGQNWRHFPTFSFRKLKQRGGPETPAPLISLCCGLWAGPEDPLPAVHEKPPNIWPTESQAESKEESPLCVRPLHRAWLRSQLQSSGDLTLPDRALETGGLHHLGMGSTTWVSAPRALAGLKVPAGRHPWCVIYK